MASVGIWASLFWAFAQVGLLGFGGGPGSLGLIEAVTVGGHHWFTTEQFAEVLAVGNALPGPIATKMAGFIGYRVGGWGGLAAAVLGVILPSLALLLGAFALIQRYQANPYVAGAVAGIRPVVAVLLALIVWQLVPHVVSSPAAWFVAFGLVALAALTIFRVPAVFVVLGAMAGGALLLRPGA